MATYDLVTNRGNGTVTISSSDAPSTAEAVQAAFASGKLVLDDGTVYKVGRDMSRNLDARIPVGSYTITLNAADPAAPPPATTVTAVTSQTQTQ